MALVCAALGDSDISSPSRPGPGRRTESGRPRRWRDAQALRARVSDEGEEKRGRECRPRRGERPARSRRAVTAHTGRAAHTDGPPRNPRAGRRPCGIGKGRRREFVCVQGGEGHRGGR